MRKRKYLSLTSDYTAYSHDTPMPMIHNIVATSQIKGGLDVLDLDAIHASFPFSFYDRKKFAAITLRLYNPECTTLLFSSGKLVVTGCKTWYECIYASLFVAKIIEDAIPGYRFRLKACDIQNMVARVELPVGKNGCLDISAMYSRKAINCTYKRKMFPGLVYRPESSPVVLLCFNSGKIVITGGKTMDDMYAGWNKLWPTIRPFIIHGKDDGGL